MTTVIQVAALGAFVVAGAAWPRREERWFERDTVVNLATGLALVVLRWSALGVLLAALDTGWISLAGLPLIAQWILAFLLLDFSRWALHLAHHRVPFFWQFHRVHHSSEHLNATSGLRMHVVDFVQLALLPTIWFSVIFDLSGSPAWLLPSVLVPGAVFDAFQHANLHFPVDSRLGRLWDRVLNNPHFHAWHHTAEGHLCDGNYGNVLTIWDRLFGTCVSRPGVPAVFGLDSSQRLVNDPVGLQLLRRPGA